VVAIKVKVRLDNFEAGMLQVLSCNMVTLGQLWSVKTWEKQSAM